MSKRTTAAKPAKPSATAKLRAKIKRLTKEVADQKEANVVLAMEGRPTAKQPEVYGLRDIQRMADAGDQAARKRLNLYWRLLEVRTALHRTDPDQKFSSFFSGTLGGEETVPTMERLEQLHQMFFTKTPESEQQEALGGWKPDPDICTREEVLEIEMGDPNRFLIVDADSSCIQWEIGSSTSIRLLVPEGTTHADAVKAVEKIAAAVRTDYPAMIRGEMARPQLEAKLPLRTVWNAVLDDPEMLRLIEKVRASVPPFVPLTKLMRCVLRCWDFDEKKGQDIAAEMGLSDDESKLSPGALRSEALRLKVE